MFVVSLSTTLDRYSRDSFYCNINSTYQKFLKAVQCLLDLRVQYRACMVSTFI